MNFGNENDEEEQKPHNNSQIVIDSGRLRESINYNDIDITSIECLNEAAFNRYEMPTFSSQMKSNHRQVRTT